ncbi:hypothetical protein GH714_012028 [Hevea brasiliensis]|uniref:Uncharacterized protein n=1 Tax=Hevea brasiliensis TaxID=3981 RepID=A0A6A6LS75_HEVBR|nr:hypothetical protein GH714_012028 [Hevea brasiliensis]
MCNGVRKRIGGEVDIYVEHLTMDELRRELRRETEDMQLKRKGVVLEEIDEDLDNAILENNTSTHHLTDQQFEHREGSGIVRNLIKLGHYRVDDASLSEVDIGNNGVDVRGNEVESDRLNEVKGEYVVRHRISEGKEYNETENFHAQTVA